MLTVREALTVLREKDITNSEQLLRRWLREGRIQAIPPIQRKDGWRIDPEELDRFTDEFRLVGTAYEVGIDDATRVVRLKEEMRELRKQIVVLEKENFDLRIRLGEQQF